MEHHAVCRCGQGVLQKYKLRGQRAALEGVDGLQPTRGFAGKQLGLVYCYVRLVCGLVEQSFQEVNGCTQMQGIQSSSIPSRPFQRQSMALRLLTWYMTDVATSCTGAAPAMVSAADCCVGFAAPPISTKLPATKQFSSLLLGELPRKVAVLCMSCSHGQANAADREAG